LGNVTNYYLQLNFDFVVFSNIDIEIDNLKILNSDKISLIMHVSGIKLTNNKIDQGLLLNLLQYYLILNNYYIYNNGIYEKIENTLISYKFLNNVDKILYKEFQENVIKFFLENYNCYFDGFDFNYLLKNYFIKSKNIIENLIDITTNKINPDFSLMEFTDGIYSLKYNTFIKKSQTDYLYNNVCTLKYYNKSFSSTRQKKPENWVNGICNALGIEKLKNIEFNEDFLKIIKAFGLIFQDEKIKQSTLFVYGPSNSGKTTLIVIPLTQYFGLENTGTIMSTKNFKYQDLSGKTICIIDEGRYNSSMSSDLLKFMGQENVLIERKYENHLLLNSIPIFIISNNQFEDKNEEINEALKNRMLIVEFIESLINNNLYNDYKKKIKSEEPNIIVYCNKLFFKIFKEKKTYKNNFFLK
jgi:hypothetical protein